MRISVFQGFGNGKVKLKIIVLMREYLMVGIPEWKTSDEICVLTLLMSLVPTLLWSPIQNFHLSNFQDWLVYRN